MDDPLVRYDPDSNPLAKELTNMAGLTKAQKLKELKRIVTKAKKDVGDGKSKVNIKLGTDLKPLEFIPSRFMELDQMCGQYTESAPREFKWSGHGGPVLKGRFVVWWGSRGCAKTTTALAEAGVAQAMGMTVGYWNSERTLDPVWCIKQGVNLEELIVWEGGNLEENMDSMIDVLERGLLDLIIVDTIHAFASKADTQASGKGKSGKKRGMGDEPPLGRLAAKLSRFFRVATSQVAEANVGVLLIGQARQNDDWEQLTGGHALLHYATLILHFIRIQGKDHPKLPHIKVPGKDGKNKKVPIGFVMKVVVDKTKTNHRENDFIEIPFIWGLGPDQFESNVDVAVRLKIIAKAGAFYTLRTADGDIKIQGRDNLMTWMRGNQPYYDWLMSGITGGFKEPAEMAAEVELEVEKPKAKPKPKKKGSKK